MVVKYDHIVNVSMDTFVGYYIWGGHKMAIGFEWCLKFKKESEEKFHEVHGNGEDMEALSELFTVVHKGITGIEYMFVITDKMIGE
jgi:nanoRNase/pAp phosphatase (c-di-AMP/oligoRNAs hydrolase)